MHPSRLDRIKGCFLLGACGDTLGAPLEGIRSLAEITKAHGPAGLSEIIDFNNAYGLGIDYPAGRLTDDTTMTMTTAAALLLAGPKPKAETLRRLFWQGYLNWGSFQDESGALKDRLDATIPWPEAARAFWFTCGAGSGTIAALLQDAPGSVSTPLNYDCTVRGKRVRGPNPGCGGMMRVAPIAFLDGESEKIFETACACAAVTHGNPVAFVAGGVIALYTWFSMRGGDFLSQTEKILETYEARAKYREGARECLWALRHARAKAAREPASLAAIDALPRELGYENAFLSAPVLAQVTYALAAETSPEAAVILSVNHGGDSDSVGAIVGNILGARHGAKAVPERWAKALLQYKDIEALAEQFEAVLSGALSKAA